MNPSPCKPLRSSFPFAPSVRGHRVAAPARAIVDDIQD
jgi:hypothetical protein